MYLWFFSQRHHSLFFASGYVFPCFVSNTPTSPSRPLLGPFWNRRGSQLSKTNVLIAQYPLASDSRSIIGLASLAIYHAVTWLLAKGLLGACSCLQCTGVNPCLFVGARSVTLHILAGKWHAFIVIERVVLQRYICNVVTFQILLREQTISVFLNI